MADEPDAQAAPAETETEGSAEGDAAAAAPSKKKRMLLIVSVVVALVGIAVAVGVVFMFGGGDKKAAAAPAADMSGIATYDAPEFSLSLLSDDPNAQHFIKMKLTLELANSKDLPAMEKLLPRLQDDWGGFLRQMRAGDLQGSANLQRLKEGLLRRANQSLDPVAVKAVYIREMLVQ
jgi:flagellar FliL protein